LKKKIVILGVAYPYRGGIAACNERLAEEYQKNGAQVKIYTFTVQYPSILFPGKTQYANWEAPDGLIIERALNSINPLNWIKFGLKLKKEAPDLLIIRHWMPFFGPAFGTVLRFLKKNKKTKVISIVDNMIPHEQRPGDMMFNKYFVSAVDAFIAMSGSVLKDIQSLTSKPSLVSPHPLFDHYGQREPSKHAQKKLGLSGKEFYILFFGLVRKYKGLDLLLEAMSHPNIKNKPIKLIIAGEFYDKMSYYTDIIKEHQLEDYVIIKNEFIPNEEVADYFNAADLVVQPYKSATQSGVTQIAYHFNKPMVVTNVGGLPEMVPDEKTGYVTEPQSGKVAEAIIKYYDHPQKEHFTSHILEQKKKYSWQTMVDAVEKLYNKITENE
jgi:glycosyltransferase involved in cell wall biosynthesis